MASRLLRFQRLTSDPKSSLLLHFSRPTIPSLPHCSPRYSLLLHPKSSNSFQSCNRWILSREFFSPSVNLVTSEGKPEFEIPGKNKKKKNNKWKTAALFGRAVAAVNSVVGNSKIAFFSKKPPRLSQTEAANRIKMQRKREKTKGKTAKQQPLNFSSAEARVKYMIEQAKLKEALLVEKLKKLEFPQVQVPNLKEDQLTEVMSPVDTISQKRALETSKYEQLLETVRRFIAIAEEELELYYRGGPNTLNSDVDSGEKKALSKMKKMGAELISEGNVSSSNKIMPERSDDCNLNDAKASSNDEGSSIDANVSSSYRDFSAYENGSFDKFLAGDGAYFIIWATGLHEKLTGTETDSEDERIYADDYDEELGEITADVGDASLGSGYVADCGISIDVSCD